MKSTNNGFLNSGLTDLKRSLSNIDLPLYLAYSDIRQRYRRSSLGPFWITISTGVMIGSMGVIFGTIFKAPMSDFFPFLAAGLILWNFISAVLTESCTVFSVAEPIIKQLPIPLFSHIIRMIARNFYIFLHNLIIFPIVLLIVKGSIGANDFLFIPGLAILILNLGWISLLLGIICARFRDLEQIVSSILQILFYITPIIWLPSLLPARASVMIISGNPLFHILQIVRAPLLNQIPEITSWVVSLTMAAAGWTLSLIIFTKFRNKIAYWL